MAGIKVQKWNFRLEDVSTREIMEVELTVKKLNIEKQIRLMDLEKTYIKDLDKKVKDGEVKIEVKEYYRMYLI